MSSRCNLEHTWSIDSNHSRNSLSRTRNISNLSSTYNCLGSLNNNFHLYTLHHDRNRRRFHLLNIFPFCIQYICWPIHCILDNLLDILYKNLLIKYFKFIYFLFKREFFLSIVLPDLSPVRQRSHWYGGDSCRFLFLL